MSYSESDTRAKFIDKKLISDWWSEDFIIREYKISDWRKILWWKHTSPKFADYVLRYNWKNIWIIEAKSYDKEITEWLEQVKWYAEKLHIRFVYTSNGQWIYEFDMQSWKWDFIQNYPTPQELYDRYFEHSNKIKDILLNQQYNITWNVVPRYYQELAINHALEAIADGKDRILLTLATWTWKTFIAFQLVWKLFQAKWSRFEVWKQRPKILFLADRNILVDQAMNTFNPMEKDIIKITWEEVRKRNGKVPHNANVFFAIYQAIIWDKAESEEDYEDNGLNNYFKQYDPDFFDLIIIDECHRWWANETGSRHEILEYFSSAVQIWLTATPKRQDNIDTYKYFWNPVYQYSLKEWINDWFLTPYKVKRIHTSIDEIVLNDWDKITQWWVEISVDQTKKVYTVDQFEREIVIPERTDLIAQAILNNINQNEKTIVFCVDQAHALRMRDSINKYKTNSDVDYCVRVTSDEWQIWRWYLERFQDNDKTIPTILTSSQMLTTWVDARNIRNIVLVRNIWSMVEFKQIIWRWTRLFDWKDFFTILDFTWATNKFYDDDWDWEPEAFMETEWEMSSWTNVKDIDSSAEASEWQENEWDEQQDFSQHKKIYVQLGDERVLRITDIDIRYVDENWRPITAEEFLKKLVWDLPNLYESEQQLREIWSNPDTREELLNKLSEMWIGEKHLEKLKEMFDAQDCDIFDVLAHISFNTDLKKRIERVAHVKWTSILFAQYEDLNARDFLDFLLNQYAQHGVREIWKSKLNGLVSLFNRGSASEVAEYFWGSKELREAYYELQKELYEV